MGKPSVATAKMLFTLSGNQCAFPECKHRLIDEQTNVLAARICHIKGNREGSARYDKNQPEDERQSLANLVAMCPNHSDIIDNKANLATYTVERLIDIKQKHENRFRGALPLADDLAENFALGTQRLLLSELEFAILVVVGKLQRATVREVASAVQVNDEKAKFYLDKLDREHRLVDWFGNMDTSISEYYRLTHDGRGLLVERGVFG